MLTVRDLRKRGLCGYCWSSWLVGLVVLVTWNTVYLVRWLLRGPARLARWWRRRSGPDARYEAPAGTGRGSQ